MANLGTMFGFYFIFAAVYAGAKAFFKIKKSDNMIPVAQLIFIGAVLSFSYFANLAVTKDLTGVNQDSLAMMVTLFPWVFFLGLIIVLLEAFPGWKAPFSNTIGYAVAKGLGVASVMYELLNEKTDRQRDLVDKVYNRPALLANMFTPENVAEKAKSIFKVSESNEKYKKFRSLIIVKDAIGEFCWYFITGFLIISYQSSYLANYGYNIELDTDSEKKDFCAAPKPQADVSIITG